MLPEAALFCLKSEAELTQCAGALQVAARSDAPDRAGRSRHEQNSLLALSVLTALASFSINLFGARRLLGAVSIATRRISQGVARISAAGASALAPRTGGRGRRVAPDAQLAGTAQGIACGAKDEVPGPANIGPWERALDSNCDAERSQSGCSSIALR